ncbi:Arc family DNA-binding protein [Paralcaligenes ureilyticus]|uniref:Arc-like DNA binding dprotein n=1 Tax=Paralcaligenes ureilyticus TaxID=627131 RepID=A0A4R3M8Q2_9BURK|nr:Arc family DNA-binding protein [Paralcaligenes ureilyticus]TCT09482.1 Arc-like DNA binding dprotein [Paralcaligenes ureilyticus]
MAIQDDYIKTALRLPRDLHARLLKSSEQTGKSMNAEIIARLDVSLDGERESQKKVIDSLLAKHNHLQKTVENIQASIELLTKQSKQK